MNDTVNVWIGREDLVKGGLVRDVELCELGADARDELDAVDDLLGGIVQVVRDDNLIASLEERKDRERANVATATVFMSA